jgi:MerR family transcriptional regulator, thiopeptide resistance regulator
MTWRALVDSTWTVGQVAEEFGVTVRTLHHYDEIGLLRPSRRSGSGYRLYTPADLERLGNVVVYRRLGFPLEEVAQLLDADGADLAVHLRRQRSAVTSRLGELHDLVTAIDNALEKAMNQTPISKDEMKELFGESFDEHQAEAERRWGETDAWKQSAQRTKGYSKADWEQIKAETDQLNGAFLAALRSGEPANGAAAMDAAEQHRRHIDERFYTCSHAQHRGLADLYVSDPRYLASYDESLGAPGLAQYVHDAIHANADRHEAAG